MLSSIESLLSIFLEDSTHRPIAVLLDHMQTAIMTRTTYFGVPAFKNPLDAWIYQEIITAARPDVIVEIGNRVGGGTLYLAHLCDLLGHGSVIGVDLRHADIAPVVRAHPRIDLLEGDAIRRFADVRDRCAGARSVMVIDDSAHAYGHTLAVLRTYSALVQPGGHFIVEDTICHHGLAVGPSPGPYEAVETFLAENTQFAADRSRERFLVTWNPKGFLTRVR